MSIIELLVNVPVLWANTSFESFKVYEQVPLSTDSLVCPFTLNENVVVQEVFPERILEPTEESLLTLLLALYDSENVNDGM